MLLLDNTVLSNFALVGHTVFQELLMRVNAGEAACLAVASQRNGRILTDDRDARKLAAQLKSLSMVR